MSVGFAQEKPGKSSESVMLLPSVPAVEAVTVTKFALEVAPTPTVPPLRWMAAARFVATRLGLTALEPDQNEKFAPVLLPSEPPVRVVPPQLKPLSVLVLAMLPELPASLAVTVTVLLVALAVTGTPAGQALMAVARFEASVFVLLLMAKVPAVVLPQVFVPSVPTVTPAPHEKPEAVPPTVKLPSDPGVVALTVKKVLGLVQPALTPTELPLPARLIASRTFEANVELLTRAEADQYVKFVPVLSPSEPPVSVLPDTVTAPPVLSTLRP